MFKISEIISKPVYTIYEGINVGTIKNFLYDKKNKRISGFYLFDDETETHEHFLKSNKIFCVGEDNVMIKNLDYIEAMSFSKDNEIINQDAISIDAQNLGKIIDLYCDDDFKAVSFETNMGIVLPADAMINIGKDILVFDTNQNKVNISKMKTKNKIMVANLPNIKVSILDLEEPDISQIPIMSNNYDQTSFLGDEKIKSEGINQVVENEKIIPRVKNQIVLPRRLLANPKSIIGKTAKETIYGLNGEIVVKQNQIITEKIYQKAKKHLKLFELTNCIEK